jgi:hypothetical protein
MTACWKHLKNVGLANNTEGLSALMATLMTLIVLLVLGSVLYTMVVDVTPGGIPAMGALASTRNDSGNYTFRFIGLTNYEIERDKVSIVIDSSNSSIYVGKIIGTGDCLCLGDTFNVGNLHPGTTYSILVWYQNTGSFIASLEISAY